MPTHLKAWHARKEACELAVVPRRIRPPPIPLIHEARDSQFCTCMKLRPEGPDKCLERLEDNTKLWYGHVLAITMPYHNLSKDTLLNVSLYATAQP